MGLIRTCSRHHKHRITASSGHQQPFSDDAGAKIRDEAVSSSPSPRCAPAAMTFLPRTWNEDLQLSLQRIALDQGRRPDDDICILVALVLGSYLGGHGSTLLTWYDGSRLRRLSVCTSWMTPTTSHLPSVASTAISARAERQRTSSKSARTCIKRCWGEGGVGLRQTSGEAATCLWCRWHESSGARQTRSSWWPRPATASAGGLPASE